MFPRRNQKETELDGSEPPHFLHLNEAGSQKLMFFRLIYHMGMISKPSPPARFSFSPVAHASADHPSFLQIHSPYLLSQANEYSATSLQP